jgi:hypothetical protein
MFDEPNNGGYADGGIVAFAGAGSVGMSDLYDDVEQQESGGNQNAVSPAGARGVMQLMPGTMKDPGFGVPTMAELRARGLSEEDANRLAGQKYLEAMYKRYGDKTHALMAYNWGPGKMDKWLASGADPKKVPSETRDYVKSVMGGNAASSRAATTATPATTTSTTKNPMDAFSPENLKAMQANISGLMPQSTKYADLLAENAAQRGSKETERKGRKEAANQALINFGLGLMSSKNPNFLGAIGEAGMPAAAMLKADLKDLKKEARDALIDSAQAEGLKNTAARELAGLTLQNANIAATLQAGNLDREQRVELERLQRENGVKIALINEKGANYRAILQERGANARSAASEAGANTRAQLQANVTLGTEVKQTARVYRDQAEAARDRAMTLNRDFVKETDPETKAALADQVLAELRNFGTYNNQYKAISGGSVNWQRDAFRTLNDWVKDKSHEYTSPYATAKPQATGSGSSAMSLADKIIAGQK